MEMVFEMSSAYFMLLQISFCKMKLFALHVFFYFTFHMDESG